MHKPRHIPLRAGVQGLCGCLAIRRGKARPGLCAFFLQRILFKRFEKGIRRVHLAMIRPDQQPDALRYHVQQHGVLVGRTMARLMEG